MALPAGRYGVTKNQLLKIKKLPMNTIKLIEELTEKFDLLGTAAFKNSTSVVTDSSDLVESGAVKDIVGWGNKNLLPNNGVSTTINGLVFTVNSDKSVLVNGTATERTFFEIYEDYRNHSESWNGYILSGCPSGGGEDSYRLDISNVDTASEGESGSGIIIKIDTTGKIIVRIRIANGYTANNLVFKPMIRKADVTDSTYEPYHASVEESLEQKCDNSTIAPVENGTTASQAYAVREHFIRNGAFCTVTQAISSGGTLTEGTNYTAGDVASELQSYHFANGVYGQFEVDTFGKVVSIAKFFGTSVTNSDGKTLGVLPSNLRPPINIMVFSKIYNSSEYVDCTITIEASGNVFVRDLFGRVIDGAQPVYIMASISYIVK